MLVVERGVAIPGQDRIISRAMYRDVCVVRPTGA